MNMAAGDSGNKSQDEYQAEVERLVDAMPAPPALVACEIGTPSPTLGEFADRTERLLAYLTQLHPVFRGLYLIGNNKKDSPLLAPDVSNLRAWVFTRSWDEKAPTNAQYSHQRPDGSLSSESSGGMGFKIYLGNLNHDSSKLRIDIGGGNVAIEFPPNQAEELCGAAFVKMVLQKVVELSSIRCAFTMTRRWHRIVNPRALDWEDLPIGGITYSSDGTIVEALPPGVQWEPFGPSGVLIKVSERPDLLLPKDTAAAIAVRDALASHGVLKLVNPKPAL